MPTILIRPIGGDLVGLGTGWIYGGPALEPGSGSVELIGQAPDAAQMAGVERDQTKARISSWLYP